MVGQDSLVTQHDFYLLQAVTNEAKLSTSAPHNFRIESILVLLVRIALHNSFSFHKTALRSGMLMHWPIADEAFGMTDRKRPRQLMLTNTGDYDEESFSHGIHEDEPLNERLEPSSKETSINPADVLCGRSKIAFNHGEHSVSVGSGGARCTYYVKARSDYLPSSLVYSWKQAVPRFCISLSVSLHGGPRQA